jgi:SAM-dependent methyltransferase
MANAGHLVTGIDPSPASLDAARAKAGAEQVTWIQGTAESAPANAFDIALMTGHVSQFLVTEAEWRSALRAIRHALVPGGRFGFHAYNPESRVWERWTPEASRRDVALRDGTAVNNWTEVTDQSGDIVSFSHHYRFADGAVLRSDSSLRFWSDSRIRSSVIAAGFEIERVDGGWRGEPVGAGDELIFVVRR